MKKRCPPVWFCAAVLILTLIWRMVGAPVTPEQFADMKTPLWQARVLLPTRLERVMLLWFTMPSDEPETMTEEVMTSDEAALLEQAQPVWLNVYMRDEACLSRMTLDGYVCGVVAAEMPATYHIEALKAQAVAARTRVLAQMAQGGCTRYPEADICTDSSHCQGYATLTECRKKWGDSYEAYRDRILQAQEQTQNEMLTYDNEPITVLYHAISGGRTEDAQTVFSQSLPYLVSVESTGEEQARGFREETTLSFDDIAQRLNAAFPEQKLSAQDVQRTLTIGAYTDTGRVKTVQIGQNEMLATAFRSALGLRSTWFSLTMDEKGVTFHQQGYGHGVGMSQAGANSMAAAGSTYDEILLHYYPGVALEMYQTE